MKINWYWLGAIPIVIIVIAALVKGFFTVTESADFWAKQGKQFYSSFEYQNAIGAYQNALKKDPTNPAYLCGLGRCYTKLGDMERAFQQFKAANALKEDFPDAVIGEAEAYFTLGQTDKAEQLYQHAAELVNGNPDIYLKLAQIASNRGDFDSALDMYHRALEIDPSNSEAARGAQVAEQLRKRQQDNSHSSSGSGGMQEPEHISTGMGDDSPPPSEEPSYGGGE